MIFPILCDYFKILKNLCRKYLFSIEKMYGNIKYSKISIKYRGLSFENR